MTVRFQAHIPGFAYSGQDIPIQEFEDLNAVLNSLPKDRGDWIFSHWAATTPRCIMGVWNEGTSWWVMGYTDADISDLPVWKPVYWAKINGVKTRLQDGEVQSSCGGVLTLRDGRMVKKFSTKAD